MNKKDQTNKGSPYATSIPDKSDQKALNNLVAKLFPTCNTKENTMASSPKYKQLSITKFSSTPSKEKPAPLREKANTKPKTTNRIIKKQPKKETTNKIVKRQPKKENKQSSSGGLNIWLQKGESKPPVSVSVTIKKSRESKKENKEKTKLIKSDSFDKYKMNLPSFQDIMKFHEKTLSDKKIIDYLDDEMEKPLEHINMDLDDEPQSVSVSLDCKHLSDSELKYYYTKNCKYLYEVFHGLTYSARHERFKNENQLDKFTSKDLKYNTSMLYFDYRQKKLLLSSLDKQFPSKDLIANNDQYFFKVLLPELCKKIFMDVHSMNFEEATAYLDNGPLKPIF